jgi:glycerol-3-phosphate dehydrogenase
MWGEQLSQSALKNMLHVTTMNRDRDPAAVDEVVDFGAFDGGAPGDEGSTSDATSGGAVADGGLSGGADGDN